MMSSPLPARKMPRKPCSGQNIKVFVRCRPMNTQEKVGRSHSLVECHSGRDIVVRERPHDKFTKTFSFDKVFAPDSKQLDVYKCVAKPLVDEVLNGFNCTIFAYGQTGTGKTFTMEGERTEDCTTWQEDPLAGVIPRCVNHLFDELRIQKLEFTMRVSFLELYNEELFDLLSKQDDLSKLRLYEDSSRKGSCIIQGLEEVLVHSKSDVFYVIEKGSAKRQTAATLMNAHSSRSHTVFTVTIHIKENTDDGDELLKTGKLHLVDLAGSENIGRSGAVDKRAREAGNINQSLLTLGRVITSLVEKAPHVPYRESKLTRLLQDALGGRTKTSIIATVSPASINLEETLSTLDYAHRAKNITNKPEVNQKLHKKELIREYTEEIERLRLDLLAMREKNGVYLANENYQEMVETMEQQAKEITEKIAHIRTVEDELEKKTDLFLETNRLLGERTEKLEETTENLSKTRLTLRSTQTVLHHTAQERDEQKYLVAAHSKTEGALHSHSRSLINVADTTTSHVQLLHQKIDRKRTVEEHNSEETVNFETNFSNQVSSMQQTLSDFKTTHAEALNTLAADHGRAVSSLESSVSASVSELSGLGAAVTQLMGTLKGLVSRAALSGTNASQELSDAASSSSKAEMARLAQYRSEELQPLLEAVTALTVRHNTTAAQLRDTVAAKSAEWRESCLSRHLSHNEHSAALVAKLQAQLERFTVHAEQHMKRVRSIGEHTTKHTQNAEECVDHLLTLHSQQLAQLKAYSEHLAACNELAAACEEEHLRALQEASQEHAQVLECVEKESGHSADHSNDADNRHRALADQMDTLHKQVVSSAEEVSSRSEALCGSVGICLQQTSDGLAALAEKQRLRHEELHKEAATVQEEAVCVSETDAASVYSVLSLQCTALSSASSDALEHGHALRQTVATLATQHQDALAEHDLHLQERQGELHELFNVKMTKDVPTDLTPARQDYVFSRTLVATSPHERLLRRFRSMHTTHYASKQPLPQTQDSELEGNSFSSLDNSGNDPSIIDSAMCSDNEGTPGTAAECYASLAEVKDAIEKSNEFVIPSTPMMVVRQNSREDSGVFTSGIPAPVRSAPVSRSSSVSSLTDAKENRSLINGASSCGKKKRDLRSANQTGSDKQGNGEAVEGSGRPSRRVLGPQN